LPSRNVGGSREVKHLPLGPGSLGSLTATCMEGTSGRFPSQRGISQELQRVREEPYCLVIEQLEPRVLQSHHTKPRFLIESAGIDLSRALVI
jgi:hypothetical protein